MNRSKEAKRKSFLHKRGIKALKRRRRRLLYLKKKNSRWMGVSLRQKQLQLHFENKFSSYKKIRAPTHLSFKHQPEDCIRFINKIKEAHSARHKVFVKLSDVEVLDHDAIVALLAIMVRFKADKIGFNGDLPQNKTAKQILVDSGFFNGLSRTFEDKDQYVLGEKAQVICTHAYKTVDSRRTAILIERASVFLWGTKRRCTGVQRTLVELMQNTTDHADPDKPADKHWWLSIYHDREQKKVSFAFIDFGVGVFKSLESKPITSKFAGWARQIRMFFKYSDNSDLLNLILNGDFHSTVTGEPYRGKGLPGIKETMERNQLSGLHVVTNDVYGDIENQSYRTLSNHFDGTFVCWEVTTENVSLPY